MTIQEMKSRKRELGLSNQEISKRSGIPVGTLQKIFSGKTNAPRQQTIEALERVLSPYRQQAPAYQTPSYKSGVQDFCVRESQAAYKTRESGTSAEFTPEQPARSQLLQPRRPQGVIDIIPGKKQGEYTLDDYYAIPDEQRVELIDGVIYDMGAPTVMHQLILSELFLLFRRCADAHIGNCEVFLSPCDVQLNMDNKTMLQPDLFVLCKDFDIKARSIPGAPDLTVEILSPSTRSKDMLLKMNKYHDAGVREYWIIDPENLEVYVYDFTNSNFKPEVYSFDSKIPVHISGGRCSIDFSGIKRRLRLE